jgi:hypothetical protein
LTSAIDFLEELLGAGRRPARRAGSTLLRSLALIFNLTEDVAQEQHRHAGQDDHCNDHFHELRDLSRALQIERHRIDELPFRPSTI